MPIPHVHDVAGWNTLMKDKVNGPKVITFAKTSHNEDLLKFLTLMRDNKKGLNEYNLFIKSGAKYELNIDSHLHEQFKAIADQGAQANWSHAPWADVILVVIDQFNHNVADKIH